MHAETCMLLLLRPRASSGPGLPDSKLGAHLSWHLSWRRQASTRRGSLVTQRLDSIESIEVRAQQQRAQQRSSGSRLRGPRAGPALQHSGGGVRRYCTAGTSAAPPLSSIRPPCSGDVAALYSSNRSSVQSSRAWASSLRARVEGRRAEGARSAPRPATAQAVASGDKCSAWPGGAPLPTQSGGAPSRAEGRLPNSSRLSVISSRIRTPPLPPASTLPSAAAGEASALRTTSSTCCGATCALSCSLSPAAMACGARGGGWHRGGGGGNTGAKSATCWQGRAACQRACKACAGRADPGRRGHRDFSPA